MRRNGQKLDRPLLELRGAAQAPVAVTLGPLAVTVGEAAGLLGLSENTFRQHLFPRCPKIHAGKSVRIPLRLLQEFIEEMAQEEEQSRRTF